MRFFFISIYDIWPSLNIFSKVYVDPSDVEGFKIQDISNAPISLFRKAMKTHEFIMQMYEAAAPETLGIPGSCLRYLGSSTRSACNKTGMWIIFVLKMKKRNEKKEDK